MSKQHFRAVRTGFVLSATLIGLCTGGALQAQDLGLEGPTGVFVTPLAYVQQSPANNLGMPTVGYHFLDAGSVIGYFSNVSVTDGAFNRMEFGYTRDVHETAGDKTWSYLWHPGFNIFHAKVNVIRENACGYDWMPAVSVGFLERTQVHNVGGTLHGKSTNNADIYIVATKTITQTGAMPIVLSGGIRGTNAELYGFAGNATRFQAEPFGAVAFVFKGPVKSSIILASEVAPQPPHAEHLLGGKIPTLETYAIRVVPAPEGPYSKFNVDFGIAHIANHIMPGVDLKAQHQVAFGISYGF